MVQVSVDAEETKIMIVIHVSFYLVGDVALANIVKLLIIDEVHLLHSDRGPVVEAIVARTLRQVSHNILSTLSYC